MLILDYFCTFLLLQQLLRVTTLSKFRPVITFSEMNFKLVLTDFNSNLSNARALGSRVVRGWA